MTDETPPPALPVGYVVPEVWTWDKENGGPFAATNRPIAGATHESELPVGAHPFQLYSLGTPNGQKVTVLFEELLAAGHAAEYDAWKIDIGKGDQFGSGFVAVNPNSKIPALVDRSGPTPLKVFESGAILLHLAEKFGAFIAPGAQGRAATLSWLMWQMGSAPMLGGGFGHFFGYAPVKIEYAINRFAMEAKRLFSVADQRLAESPFLAGDTYTIADIAVFTWFRAFVQGGAYGAATRFLSMHEYQHLARWVEAIAARPAVQRGRIVNAPGGLTERHAATDFADAGLPL